MVPSAFFDGVDSMVARIVATVPTRIIWGRGDPYIPERYSKAFAGAHVTMLEHAGHWVPISSANEVAAAIRALTWMVAATAGCPTGHLGARSGPTNPLPPQKRWCHSAAQIQSTMEAKGRIGEEDPWACGSLEIHPLHRDAKLKVERYTGDRGIGDHQGAEATADWDCVRQRCVQRHGDIEFASSVEPTVRAQSQAHRSLSGRRCQKNAQREQVHQWSTHRFEHRAHLRALSIYRGSRGAVLVGFRAPLSWRGR